MSARALAQRLVACPRFRWMPGMLARHPDEIDGSRVCEDCEDWQENSMWVPGPTYFPDLTDPATLGCLLALVREAWDDRRARVGRATKGLTIGWCVMTDNSEGEIAYHDQLTAEALVEALVAALEAAP